MVGWHNNEKMAMWTSPRRCKKAQKFWTSRLLSEERTVPEQDRDGKKRERIPHKKRPWMWGPVGWKGHRKGEVPPGKKAKDTRKPSNLREKPG